MNPAESHTIEPELLGLRPRAVRWSTSTVVWRFVLCNLLVGVVLLLLFLGRNDLATWDDLLKRGETVTATVTDRYITHSKNSTTYHIRYRFEADGETFTDSTAVRQDLYTTLEQFEATYLPGSNPPIYQPYVVTTAGRGDRLRGWVVSVLGAGMLFGLIAGAFEWHVRAQNHLLRLGRPAVGCYISGKITQSKNGKIYHLTYRFTPQNQNTVTKDVTVTESVYNAQTFGRSLCTVLHDEANPWNAAPYSVLTSAEVLGK